jgi:hypothetical protein
VFVVVVLSGSGFLIDCIAFVFRVKLVFVVVVLSGSGVLIDCIAFVFRVKIATADDGTAVLRIVSNYLLSGTVSLPKCQQLLPQWHSITSQNVSNYLLSGTVSLPKMSATTCSVAQYHFPK